MKILKAALLASLIALTAAAATASDLDIGSGARSVAMGGAGLALGDQTGPTAVLNPAAPAATGSGFRFVWPTVSFHTSGASISDLADSISDLTDGSASNAIALVNDFATEDTSLSLASAVGFVGPFGITIEAEASGAISPGDAAMEWAGATLSFDDDSSVDLQSLRSDITNTNFQAALTHAEDYLASSNSSDLDAARASYDAYMTDLSDNPVDADIVYGPKIMFSKGLKQANGSLYLGATAKLLYSEARRWQVTAESDPNNPLTVSGTTANPVITAGVMFGAVDRPVEESTSLAVDLGMIYKPSNSIWQYGAVINNAIQPKLDGIEDSKEDTMISLGVAAVPVRGVIFAADLVNITGANDEDIELRFGGEMRLGNLFALRAGYSGQNWTYGVNLFGINLAFKGKTAQLLMNAIKF